MSFIIDDQTRAIMCQRTTQSLCFYGNKFTNENVEKFMSHSIQMIGAWGNIFDTLTLTPKNGFKSTDYKFSLQTLQKNFNASQCSQISAIKTWLTEWNDDYKIRINFNREFAIITFADEDINLNTSEISKQLIGFASLLQCPYSIYFEVPYANIPSMFAEGIVVGNCCKYFLQNFAENTHEKAMRFCRWADTGLPEKVYLRGVIRDVYPMNLLCRPQAFFSFQGKPLLECVRSGMIGGTIEEITPERFLWTVPQSDIPVVTEKCEKAGFLFNQLKDVPGDILWEDPDVAEYHKGDAQREANGKIIQKFVEAAKNTNEIPDPSELLKIFE